jgi:AcrR family transcriptional regulator
VRASRGAVSSGRRPHDAEASRQALILAAHELFEARGYDASTVREIGERAAVDPSLIVRYFGGKEGLYLATLEAKESPPPSLDPREVVPKLLGHSEDPAGTPVPRAMVSPTLTDAMRDQIGAMMSHRLIEPLAAELASRGASDPELRAEVLVSMVVGVGLTRAGGTLPHLADAPIEDVLEVLEPLIEAL